MAKKHHELTVIVNALVTAEGNKAQAARDLGLAISTFKDQLAQAEVLGIMPTILPESAEAIVQKLTLTYETKLSEMKRQLKAQTVQNLEVETIRRSLFQLADYTPAKPEWMIAPTTQGSGVPGVPTVFASDWHWGEVVKLVEMDGKNEFNREIAKERWQRMVEISLELMFGYTVNPTYPGLIFILGGDMVSGIIHEELSRTNDGEIMEHVEEMVDAIIWAVDEYLKHFKKIYIPCVPGNHGRSTLKPAYKAMAVTNFDWWIYQAVCRHFKNDARVVVDAPPTYDVVYKVYNTTYLLTHGNYLGSGGGGAGGTLGPVAPIARGAKRLKALYAEEGIGVDYVLMGHWHNPLWLDEAFVNGAGKGHDEFAKGHRFRYHPPVQLMWWTHPKYGVTYQTKIFLDKNKQTNKVAWVSFPEA